MLRALLLLVGMASAAMASPLSDSRQLYLSGNPEKAQEMLNKWLSDQNAKPSDADRALGVMLLGLVHFQQGRYEEARGAFEQVLTLPQSLSPYAFYFLGESYRRLGRHKDARQALDRVGFFKPPLELKLHVRRALAEMAMSEQSWAEADRHFRYLSAKWKRSAIFPEILYRHLEMAVAARNDRLQCQIARRLYVQYPAYAAISDWTLELQNARVRGERLGCVPSPNEQSARVRRLQLSGESDRARRELEVLRSGSGDRYRGDALLAQFLIQDGFADQALKLLIPYMSQRDGDPNYLGLVARAAARSGEFQLAIGVYDRIHRRASGSRLGREALFQAAFTSYQFQDYDGASRRFHQFMRTYAGSGLVKDARWHVAWLDYLRGYYESAGQQFAELAKPQKRRRRWLPGDERAKYWLAMSLVRLERYQDAEKIFTRLAADSDSSYYSLAAQARLAEIPKDSKPKSSDPVADRQMAMVAGEIAAESSEESSGNSDNSETTISRESEEEGASDTPLVLEESSPVDSDEDEPVIPTDVRDPRLRARFDAAQSLIAVGLFDWARHELFEVERRSRNSTYLRNLVKAFESMQAYHRSVAIAANGLAGERRRLGLQGARELWESAYPKAFSAWVERYSRQYGVSKEFVWSIMRAESVFRADAISPVGAKGLMQMMPETGRQVARLLGETEPFQAGRLFDPETSVNFGSRYLARLTKQFGQSWPLAAAAYNAGPHRVERWLASFGDLDMDEFIEHIPFLETRNYVKKVLRNYQTYLAIYTGDRKPASLLAAAVPVQLARAPNLRENWEHGE